MPGSDSQRHYSEKEMRALLARAMELKKRAEEPHALRARGEGGFSLAEVAQIAAELGIESQYLHTAAADLESEPIGGRRFQILGAPADVHMERVVEGEVGEATWETMLQEIRRAFGGLGQAGQIGRSFQWAGHQELQYVSVSSKEEGTEITIHSDPMIYMLVYLLGFMPQFVGAAVLVSLLHLAPLAEGLIAGGWVTGYFACQRLLFRSLMSRHEKKVRDLMDRLSALIERRTAPAAEPAVTAGADATAMGS
jgi:hypothetical protein